MLALLRPNSWDLPLFLHVLGATILVGGSAAVTLLAIAGRHENLQAPLLRRVALRTLLLVVVPSWILMRVAAQWILDKEYPHGHEPGWVGAGIVVSEGGLVLLIPLCIVAFLSTRQRGGQRTRLALAILSPLYLCALLVAMWAMSGKP